MSRQRLLIEAAVVAALGLVLSAVLYSDWFRYCCIESHRELVGTLTLPAILFASVIGGGVHGATAAHFVVGIVVELFCLWAMLLPVRRMFAKRSGK